MTASNEKPSALPSSSNEHTTKEEEPAKRSKNEHPAATLPRLPVDREWLQKLLRRHHPDSPQDKIKAYVLAPMVDQSDLPFRLQCRKYGTNLCFTPMIHAKLYATNKTYRKKFTLRQDCPEDRPLIAQLCGSDVNHMLYTAQAVAPYCDAIDINCGCPQSIARRGLYGAFLLEQEQVLLTAVRHLLQHLTVPLTVKVRLLPGAPDTQQERDAEALLDEAERDRIQRDRSVERSLSLYQKLVDAGIHMLTIHGRTRFQKGVGTGKADWDAIRQVVDQLGDRIPILANGSMGSQEEVRECLAATGCDGAMSSEAILEYPPLFAGMVLYDDAVAAAAANGRHAPPPPPPPRVGRLPLAMEYMDLAAQYEPHVNGQGSGVKCIRVHVHRFLHADLQLHTDLRKHLVEASTVQELRRACELLSERHAETKHEIALEELSWYVRHRNISRDCYGLAFNNLKRTAVEVQAEKEQGEKSVEAADETCLVNIFGGNDQDEEDW